MKPGGTFMINCQWTPEELEQHLSAEAKRYIAENDINLYTINAIDLAVEMGMGKRTNTILQSAFFALANILPQEEAMAYMKDAATKSYLKKGQDVVDMNHRAIDAGATAFVKVDVPAAWADAREEDTSRPRGPPRTGEAGPRDHGARWPHGWRLAARFGVRRSRRWPVRAGRSAYEKRGVSCHRGEVGCREVHRVQQLLVRVPACYHPPVRPDR